MKKTIINRKSREPFFKYGSLRLNDLRQWKRPNFDCKRKRAAAKSRGLAQKIEHCSIGANWCDLMRTVLRSTARHEAAWCEVVQRVYCKHASVYCKPALRSFEHTAGIGCESERGGCYSTDASHLFRARDRNIVWVSILECQYSLFTCCFLTHSVYFFSSFFADHSCCPRAPTKIPTPPKLPPCLTAKRRLHFSGWWPCSST